MGLKLGLELGIIDCEGVRVRKTVGFWLRLGESDFGFDGLRVGRTDSVGVVVGALEACDLQPSESKQNKHGVQPSGQIAVSQSIFPSKMRVSALEQYASTRTSLIHVSEYDSQFEISKINGGIEGASDGLSDEKSVGLSERI